MMHATPYPLTWPSSVPRTPKEKRVTSRFRRKSPRGWLQPLTVANSRTGLLDELDRFGSRGVIISSNIPLRQDGLPMSGRPAPEDPGVALFFERGGSNSALACDQYRSAADNMRALAVTIESLRRIERHGSSNLFAQAFSAFQSLPSTTPNWAEVLGIDTNANLADCETAFRTMAAQLHPDLPGGSNEAMVRLNAAIANAREHFTEGLEEPRRTEGKR